MVWHSSLTQENKDDLERMQKTFAKLVLRQNYKNYENSLLRLNLDCLDTRRNALCLKFAQAGIKTRKIDDLFPMNEKLHQMKTRVNDQYRVQFANTDRLKNSSIITMQKMLNEKKKNDKLSD